LGHRPIPVNWRLQMRLNKTRDERTCWLGYHNKRSSQGNKTNNIKFDSNRRVAAPASVISDVR
jgi:hypothetical protein